MKTIMALLLAALGAQGAALLVWDENTASDGVGKYVIYHGRSMVGPFTNYAEVARRPWPTNFVTVRPLTSGPHFFYVTAVSTNGLESDPSNQVLAPVPNPPQGLRMLIEIR